MTKHSLRSRFLRLTAAVTIGGTAFQLSGCDPDVRSALLSGLQATTGTLSATLIDAFFLTLDDDDGTGGGGNTTT